MEMTSRNARMHVRKTLQASLCAKSCKYLWQSTKVALGVRPDHVKTVLPQNRTVKIDLRDVVKSVLALQVSRVTYTRPLIISKWKIVFKPPL